MGKVNYLLEKIYTITSIPCIYYKAEINKIEFAIGDGLSKEKGLYDVINNQNIDLSVPKICFLSNSVYGVYKDSNNMYVILGPIESLKVKDIYGGLSILYFYDTGKEIEETEFATIKLNQTDGIKLRESLYDIKFLDELDYLKEENLSRYTFEDEKRFMSAVENGDIEGYVRNKKSQNNNFGEAKVGFLAKNNFKQLEYIACCTITLATRAAINGGVDVMTAYGLSDRYLRTLENCKTESEINDLLENAILEYIIEVRDNKKSRSSNVYVEKSKVYISRHKNIKFTIDDVAENVGVSKSYLSKIFLEEEGLSIHQYTIKLRTDMGANLLKNSNESIAVIAEYLCFNSQSHFGKVFKEKYGMTPQKYRNKNQIIDFTKDN